MEEAVVGRYDEPRLRVPVTLSTYGNFSGERKLFPREIAIRSMGPLRGPANNRLDCLLQKTAFLSCQGLVRAECLSRLPATFLRGKAADLIADSL